jgi:5'-deoxynucleotidase YfbR-like HD superfamily hydrolase
MQTKLKNSRAWMRLPSGRHLDLINPDPFAWEDRDLAVRLARTYRWGGESKWQIPLSVAQHSLTVLALVSASAGEALAPAQARRELLHDAEEGFLGFDCIGPLKRALGQPFMDVSERLMVAVQTRYALPVWTPQQHAAHKAADIVAAATEALHCVGWSLEEIRDVLCLDVEVLQVDPLVAIYGGTPWEPWPADVAAERFLAKLQELVDARTCRATTRPAEPDPSTACPACNAEVRYSDWLVVEGRPELTACPACRKAFAVDAVWPQMN